MREEDLSAFTEAVPIDGFVTTGSIRQVVAAKNVRESTINRRTRIDIGPTIGVGFAHISNAEY